MRLGDAHLTYCTNVHPGESWPQVRSNLEQQLLGVRDRCAPERPFGVGLRLSALAARQLLEGDELPRFKDWLLSEQLYVFTLNGFPYGEFHGKPVKQAVYQPNWTTPERSQYTHDLARVLWELLPPNGFGSISTVPGGFRPDLASAQQRQAVAKALLDQALHLRSVQEQSGRELCLALEPEPHCLLETTGELIEFFQDYLLSQEALRGVAERTGLNTQEAEELVRRHLGACIDTCHAAVEFEEPRETFASLERAGIRVAKVQLSAGLALRPTRQALAALRSFDEPVYLHQVVARTQQGELLRYLDLPEAFQSQQALHASEWRVHFHVPVHSRQLGAFSSTQPYLEEALRLHAASPLSMHLEVETYTWDVLPQEQQAGGLLSSIAQELSWVQRQIG